LRGPGTYYAIVTGVSAGLGRAFAEELARRGHSLLLVSLPGTGLPELSDSLRRQGNITVHFIETDLRVREAPKEIATYAREHGLEADILVNNAGIGHGGEIGEYSDDAIEESIFLNMRCTTLMTNLFIDELKRRERAYILNLGSFGGFMPIPYKSIYSATKSYVYYFSLAIMEELRGTGVRVSVAMPGPVLTNHKVRERISRQGFLARSNVIEAEKAAVYMLDRMFSGRGLIIPRWTMRMSYYAGCLLPFRVLMLITGRLFRGIN
jgi:short-subunit dehydrogenase